MTDVGPGEIDPDEFGSEDFYKYDGEIVRADDNLQRFVSKLKTIGVYDNTLLIVSADHGEAFGEHEKDLGHGGKPYNTVTHIPLVMHLPDVLSAGTVIDVPVQTLDIASLSLGCLDRFLIKNMLVGGAGGVFWLSGSGHTSFPAGLIGATCSELIAHAALCGAGRSG